MLRKVVSIMMMGCLFWGGGTMVASADADVSLSGWVQIENDEGKPVPYVHKVLKASDGGNYISIAKAEDGFSFAVGLDFVPINWDQGAEKYIFKDGVADFVMPLNHLTDQETTFAGTYPLYKLTPVSESGVNLTVGEWETYGGESLKLNIQADCQDPFLLAYTLDDPNAHYHFTGIVPVRDGASSIITSQMGTGILPGCRAESLTYSLDGVILFDDAEIVDTNLDMALGMSDNWANYSLGYAEPQTGLCLVELGNTERGLNKTVFIPLCEDTHAMCDVYFEQGETSNLFDTECLTEITTKMVKPEAVVTMEGEMIPLEKMEVYEAAWGNDASADVPGDGSADVSADVSGDGSVDVSADVSADAELIVDQALTKAVQQKLNESGFDCGTPDGIAGQKTFAAIEAYQTANGLNVTKVIDKELVAHMGIQ